MRASCVTGGAGFIGSHLVTALAARGDRVRVLDDLSTGRRSNLAGLEDRIEWREGDAADPATAAEAVAGADVVFHLAALPSVPLSLERPLDVHRACATSTLVMLDAARRAGVRRFVYAGSSSAYGQAVPGAQCESQRAQPLSPYAASKLAGESYCEAFFHAYGLETVVLRFFNVYGERQDPTSPYSAVVPLFTTRLLRDEPLIVYGDGGQTRDFCYVGDVVRALALAAESPAAPGGLFNVAHGEATSVAQLIDRLANIVGRAPRLDRRPARSGEIRDSRADLEQTRSRLGFESRTSLDEGLRRTVAYYAERASRAPTA